LKKEWRDFDDAKEFVHRLRIKNQRDWTTYCKSDKKPEDIPYHPERQYKNKGWINYGDWLGTGMIRHKDRKYWSYEKAREYVHKLELKNSKVWREYTKSGKLPKQIPADPNNVYKNKGWISTGDWLGTGSVASYLKEYWSFEKARDYVHNLKLKSQLEWTQYIKSGKLPKQIPATPQGRYKNKGWKGIGDWLGTGTIATQSREYLTFEESKTYVHNLKLKSQKQWRTFTKSKNKPNNVPANPEKVYKNKGWKGIGDWLGTGRKRFADVNWLPWSEAKSAYKKIARENQLKTYQDWRQYIKNHDLPEGLPKTPDKFYTKESFRKMMK